MAFPKRLPTRWLGNTMARLAFLSGVGYVAAAYTASRFLTRSRRHRLQTSPLDWGMESQTHTIETEDGIRLAAWSVEPPEPRGTVALFHGMRHCREQMLARMAFLVAAGYRCIAIDHRAHGESSGKRVSFGWYESRDVRATANWIEHHHPSQPRFALGASMGAAAICFAGSECGWSGVILEGAYADIGKAFRRRIGLYFPAWFAQLYPAIIWITQKRLRLRLDWVRPVEAVKKFGEARKLFVTGDLDLLAPVTDAAAITANAQSAEFMVVPGAGHNDLLEKGGAEYQRKVLEFLGR